MSSNARTHLEMAELYETLSANESASLQKRRAFSRKANWHRILARMSADKKFPVAKEHSDGNLTENVLFSPKRLWDARDRNELAKAEANAFGKAKQRMPNAR